MTKRASTQWCAEGQSPRECSCCEYRSISPARRSATYSVSAVVLAAAKAKTMNRLKLCDSDEAAAAALTMTTTMMSSSALRPTRNPRQLQVPCSRDNVNPVSISLAHRSSARIVRTRAAALHAAPHRRRTPDVARLSPVVSQDAAAVLSATIKDNRSLMLLDHRSLARTAHARTPVSCTALRSCHSPDVANPSPIESQDEAPVAAPPIN